LTHDDIPSHTGSAMAWLCVDIQAQQAMEQMREALEQAPDSFIARLGSING